MVPAQVILAGGAGVANFNDECAKVFAAFSPPIVSGTYSSVSSQRQADVAENGSDSPYKNQQSEHFVPNSNLKNGPGRGGENIPGGGDYSEGTGFTYNVYDDQSQGTEHKWLTDAERQYAQELEGQTPPQNASLNDWLDRMEGKTAEMLDDDGLQRQVGQGGRSRIKDAQNMSKEDRKKLAQAAAKCLRLQAEAQFKKQKVSPGTPLRNGQAGGLPPPAPPAAMEGGGGAP
jgi:hypothetical protein